MRHLYMLLAFSMIAGCGGGDGGSSGGESTGISPKPTDPVVTPSQPDNGFLKFSPPKMNALTFSKDAYQHEMRVTATSDIPDNANVQIKSQENIVKDVTIRRISKKEFFVAVTLDPNISIGEHKGVFEVRICKDSPEVCANPYAQGSSNYEYSIKQLPESNLKPLSAFSSQDWSNAYGDERNSKHIPVNLDINQISKRWTYYSPGDEPMLPKVVTAEGKVFMLSSRFSSYGTRTGQYIRAIDEATGAMAWEVQLSGNVKDLYINQGKVIVTAPDLNKILTFEPSTGNFKETILKFAHNLSLRTQAILPSGEDIIYFYGFGSSGGITSQRSNAIQWNLENYSLNYRIDLNANNPILVNGDMIYTPAVDSSDNSGLLFLNKENGQVKKFIKMNIDMNNPPVMIDNSVCAANRDQNLLQCFDKLTGNLNWKTSTPSKSFSALPSYIASTDGHNVEWINKSNGAVVNKSGKIDIFSGGFVPDPNILTFNNMAVLGYSGTSAIKPGEEWPSWTWSEGSAIAVSRNGILYVVDPGKLVAFNLH